MGIKSQQHHSFILNGFMFALILLIPLFSSPNVSNNTCCATGASRRGEEKQRGQGSVETCIFLVENGCSAGTDGRKVTHQVSESWEWAAADVGNPAACSQLSS